jgi:phospholipase/carboxylesterase
MNLLDHDVVTPKGGATHQCLVLHGLGDTKHGWQPVAQMLGIERLGFVFAHAPIPYHEGASWFDLSPNFEPDASGVRASRDKLWRLIEHLLATFGIGSDKLFLLGFSQGALMAIDTALRYRSRFAGVLGISGFMAFLDEYPAAFSPCAREQEFLLTHGLYDPMIPIAHVRRQKDTLRRLGCSVDWREYAKEHSIDPEQEIPDIRAWLRKRMA